MSTTKYYLFGSLSRHRYVNRLDDGEVALVTEYRLFGLMVRRKLEYLVIVGDD
jgi:hypothetical protein